MHSPKNNPHLDKIIASIKDEAFDGAPREFQLQRASELDMTLEQYQEWLREFLFLTASEQKNHALTLARCVAKQVTSSTTSSAPATR